MRDVEKFKRAFEYNDENNLLLLNSDFTQNADKVKKEYDLFAII